MAFTSRRPPQLTTIQARKQASVNGPPPGHPEYNAELSPTRIQDQNRPAPRAVIAYPSRGEAEYDAFMTFTAKRPIHKYEVSTGGVANAFDIPILKKLMSTYGIGGQSTSISNQPEENSEPANTPRDGGNPGGTTTTSRGSNQELSNAISDKALQDAVDLEKNQGNNENKFKSDPTVPIVRLYFPMSYVVNDDIAYSEVGLGGAGLTAEAGLRNGGSLLSALGIAIGEGFESIYNLAAGNLTQQAAQIATARLVQNIPNDAAKAVLTGALQTTVNPGTRVMFEKPNVRTFVFQYRLLPTDAREANDIAELIKTFRRNMYPKALDAIRNLPLGYEFPPLFQIDFGIRGGAKIPKVELCYLKNVQANYNPEQMVFHSDGHPMQVDLSLTFQEYRALTQQDIDRGY
jgi:hypothetical protein